MRRWIVAIGVVVGLAGSLALGSVGAAASDARPVSVDGAVAKPAAYSVVDLARMPSTTVQVSGEGRTHTERGVPLEELANLSQPALPNAKNANLRVALTVRGDGGEPVSFALGELDPAFGNHPAVLSIEEDGAPLERPKLVVPGDCAPLRFVDRVDRITVGVESPAPTTPPAGAVDVTAGRHEMLLTAAHVHVEPATWVAAVGSDGYVAMVTPAEALVGGRTLLVSTVEDGVPLSQPRLVAGGDVKGGRYVSLMVDLVVGRGSVAS